jgi:hypothetical protein
MAISSHISILNSTSESSDRRNHQYSCGCKGDEDVPEVSIQLVRSVSSFGMLRRDKTGPFHGPWKHPALNPGWTLTSEALRCILVTGRKLKKFWGELSG